ncbi:DegQ family serine endoprotease [Kingella sp. SNUBH-2017]|uniref:Probable periplasmic serine endoprotease DegP-like n=1 Tax=Kingella pumchi TaxID=2779506 RepID=A0ABS9NMF1_9NEIS|nr:MULTISPECIES: DegQ family serine endoprotease [Kingella]MCG6503976.1 DegQ family serine endoprotease [Kingella pumchi]MDD2183378.1 DegQ family serine endoprotease [Kingella sp. SNUBH-2017]
MNKPTRPLILLPLAAALALAGCNKKNDTDKPAEGSFVTKVEVVKGNDRVGMLLPDFAELVAREGGSVVNIQALREEGGEGNSDGSAEDPFSDFFKRIVPNQPEDGDGDDANFGSGVIISADGYILTNAHVVKGKTNIKATLNDKREYHAKLIGADDKSDIALLKIDAEDLPAAKIGNPNELKSGEWVAAIGAPFGFDNSVTAGIVSAKGRTLPNETYTSFIQTDVAINPGNSGGPLFNLKGQVVGINSQIYSRSGGFMGISFAIPIDTAMNVAEQLKTDGKVQRGQLGVVIQEVTHDLAKSFGLDKPTGALVSKVLPNSPAAAAGLQVGDIIRGVNGKEIVSSGDLPVIVGSTAPGKEVKLQIWRQRAELEVGVTLGSAGDISQSAAGKPEAEVSGAGSENFNLPEAGLVLSAEADGRIIIVRTDGAAARAGLQRGDVIREIAGMAVHSREEVSQAFAKGGKNLPVLIQREGTTLFLALVLP